MENKIHSTLIKQFIEKCFIKTNSLNDKLTEKELIEIYQEWSKTIIDKTKFHKLLQDNKQVSFTTKRYYVCLKINYEALNNNTHIEKEKEEIINTKSICNNKISSIDELNKFLLHLANESNEQITISSSKLYNSFIDFTGAKNITLTRFGLDIKQLDFVKRNKSKKGTILIIDTEKLKQKNRE